MADDGKLLEYLKRATGDLHDARRRLREAEGHAREPIAIVGMSCRYPGNVHSPQDLWETVAGGGGEIGPFSTDRGWGLEKFFDMDEDRPGAIRACEGGFLNDAAEFDSEFFGISP